MSSVTVGLSPHNGQLAFRLILTSLKSMLRASIRRSLEVRLSPIPIISLSVSTAWMLPTRPVRAPRTPASAQLGTMPGGGGEGNKQR